MMLWQQWRGRALAFDQRMGLIKSELATRNLLAFSRLTVIPVRPRPAATIFLRPRKWFYRPSGNCFIAT